MHVHRALRPAGRAARVRDEQRVLAVDVERVEAIGAESAQLVERDVATRLSSARRCDPSRGTTTTVCTVGTCATAASAVSFIGTTLPRRVKPSAVITATAPASCEPDRDRVGAVAGEDRQEDRAELRDREQRGDRLGHHRHEQADRVAALDTAGGQPRRDAIGERSQLGARERADLALLAFPDDRRARRALGIVGAAVDARRPRGCSDRR